MSKCTRGMRRYFYLFRIDWVTLSTTFVASFEKKCEAKFARHNLGKEDYFYQEVFVRVKPEEIVT